jgi:hypothetical protein
MNRRTLLFAAALGLALPACFLDDIDDTGDPRLGELGRVHFNGGGCSGSTQMAIGSHETLTLEPVAGVTLPADLEVRATAPEVISAEAGAEPATIVLRARDAGRSQVQLLDHGEAFDALTFGAEPARVVRFEAPPVVFTGAALDLVVTDVFGACGTDECPLFGHSFLTFRSEPEGAMDLALDDGGTATFHAGAAGALTLFGREPALHRDVVAHGVTIVPTDGFTTLHATLATIPLLEGEEARSFPLPGAVAPGTFFCVRIDALDEVGATVPVSRRDVSWEIQGEPLVSLVPMDHATEPYGTLFVASSDAGSVELEASVALLGVEATFALEVAGAPPSTP